MMVWFNDELIRRTTPVHGLSVHNVTGFNCHPDGTAMSVEEWFMDGSHPGRDFSHPSFNKYFQEVRSAMYRTIAKYSAA